MVTPRACGTIEIDGLAVFYETEGKGSRTPERAPAQTSGWRISKTDDRLELPWPY